MATAPDLNRRHSHHAPLWRSGWRRSCRDTSRAQKALDAVVPRSPATSWTSALERELGSKTSHVKRKDPP
jgi:hypothetical protein